jgi:hypothetical protein
MALKLGQSLLKLGLTPPKLGRALTHGPHLATPMFELKADLLHTYAPDQPTETHAASPDSPLFAIAGSTPSLFLRTCVGTDHREARALSS